MNTNDVLTKLGFRAASNFGQLAREASLLDFTSEAELAAWAREHAKGSIKGVMQAEHAPLSMFLPQELMIDYKAVDQITTALRLPVAVRGALMPDAHLGYSLPIGGVVSLHQVVSPAFVGYDIGCRMQLSALQGIDPEMLFDTKEQAHLLHVLQESTVFGLGVASHEDHPIMERPEWSEITFLKQFRKLAKEQLGTSGAGNHFVELVYGTTIYTQAHFMGILSHSGSRGIGNKAGHYYALLAEKETHKSYLKIPQGYGWLDMDSDAGREYWTVMNLLGEYAQANHDIIHDRIMKKLGVTSRLKYENHHNFAWKNGDEVIHRKGATPAEKGRYGIIPGSCSTKSYLVVGMGNKDSIESASHGAGRAHSRTAAKQLFDRESFENRMNTLGIAHSGIAKDETSEAYKDIEAVMRAQEKLVDIAAVMEPRVVVMGGGTYIDDGD